NPRYLSRIYPIRINKDNVVELEGTNLTLESKYVYELLKECNDYYVNNESIRAEIIKEIEEHLATLEKDLNKTLGCNKNPLL
ncbi:hypothetical protein D1N77_20040, partial [Clostridioides difficile]